MEKTKINIMLEKIKADQPNCIAGKFVTSQEFKKRFFDKVQEDAPSSQNSSHFSFWLAFTATAACVCVVCTALFGSTVSNILGGLTSAAVGGDCGAANMAAARAVRSGCPNPAATAHGCPNPDSWTFVSPERPRTEIQVNANTEEYKQISENPFLDVRLNPLSTFGADVDTASYSNVRRMLNNNWRPPKDAVRLEEFVNAFSYDYPAPQGKEKFAVTFEAAQAPWNKEHKLLLIGVQAKDHALNQLPPAHFVFLVDNSGSMLGEMEKVREALNALIDKMRPEDKISLVTYGGGSRVILKGCSGRNKFQAKSLLQRLTAGGSTHGSSGIQTAYRLAHKYFIPNGNNRIILVTDGDFNVGVSSESELVEIVEKERSSLIYLSAFGMGYGNYKDNKLKMLANKGNGNYFYIDSLREARNAAKNCFAGKMFTLARDVKFQVEFNPARIKGYRQLGYELRQLSARDFNDDTKDSGEVGVGHQVTVLYELIPAESSSKASGSVDALKYQKSQKTDSAELLTLKLRYQEPTSHGPSQLREFTLKDYPGFGINLNWASAVAEFAMVLRNSPDKGKAALESILKRAKQSVGSDTDGRRAEFITLVHLVQDMPETRRLPNADWQLDTNTW